MLSRCMMTSPEDWERTYAASRNRARDMAATCLSLREEGVLM